MLELAVAREPIPTHTFVVVVVRLGRRFLVIRERKHGQTWYLPAGRLEPGDTVVAAALRETREEAGIEVAVEGVLRLEFTPYGAYNRQRFWLLASPVTDAEPGPTSDSLDARWLALDEMAKLDLRGPEVLEACRSVLSGAAVYPLTLITPEGSTWGRSRI